MKWKASHRSIHQQTREISSLFNRIQTPPLCPPNHAWTQTLPSEDTKLAVLFSIFCDLSSKLQALQRADSFFVKSNLQS